MKAARWLTGLAVGALVATAAAVVPALGAPGSTASAPHRAAAALSGIDSFTPAAADPRLAALFAQGNIDTGSFRFTPSQARRQANRAVVVAVRARSSQTALAAERASIRNADLNTVQLTPIAYNLGVAVGWRRLGISGDLARVDLGILPGSRESVDVGVSYSGRRLSGRVGASADRPIGAAPRLTEEAPGYSLDVGTSYRLSQRVDVTAGLRYRAERDSDRLRDMPSATDRRDSQSVYVGTAFRF